MKREQPIFTGSACAIVTPFDKHGTVDPGCLDSLIRRQIEAGTDAIVVVGTTGEATALNEEERALCIRTAVDAAAGRCPVIAGAGSNSTLQAVRLAKLAQDAGADAILCSTPYYCRATEDGLLQHFFASADAVQIPMLLYNVPSRCGMTIPISAYPRLARHPRIVGVKEASGDLSYAARAIWSAAGTLDFYAGCDDVILPYLSLGAVGVISVAANLEPDTVSGMCRDFLGGEVGKAARTQRELLPLCERLFSVVNPVPVKYLMAKEGLCENVLRLPLTAIDSLSN